MKEIISSKEKAIKAISEYRENVVRAFFRKSRTVIVDLEKLNELGYDEKRKIRIEDKPNVNGECFYEVKRSILCDIIVALRTMKDKNITEAIEIFENAYTEDIENKLSVYKELEEMSCLALTYTEIEGIENRL